MIGAFARMLGTRDRVLTCEQTGDHAWSVRSRDDAGRANEAGDQPPEGFVERIPHEGGDVVFAPILETLREVLRGGRRRAGERATVRGLPHNDEPSQGGR